ncbi:hypothetical protein ACFWB1_32320 [Streptomyces goshikiensis]|uniref:MmyB family transcriptional regulator n=1 Tax=Streptomyces goshikiensis TaxID=1942 RepID=UPI0036C2CCD3
MRAIWCPCQNGHRLRAPRAARGPFTLDYVVLAAEDDPEQSLAIYTPEPASPSAEALGILASWTSTSTTAAPEQTHNPPN